MICSSQVQRLKNCGFVSCGGSSFKDDKEDDASTSELDKFRPEEEEIERKKIEVRDTVSAHLGRVEDATRRLSLIRQELDSLYDPVTKEVAVVTKKIDTANTELKTLGAICQKKEREYKEALEAFNKKNEEKAQLVSRLMELVSESGDTRMNKLEELRKNAELVH